MEDTITYGSQLFRIVSVSDAERGDFIRRTWDNKLVEIGDVCMVPDPVTGEYTTPCFTGTDGMLYRTFEIGDCLRQEE